mgnify:CR=1 FL=1
MNIRFRPLLLCLSATVFVHMGAGIPATAQQQQPDLGALLQGIMQGANQKTQDAPALVNFRELKAQLPAELPDMKRISASGEKTGAFGMSVAFAEATYRGEDGGTISIKITDSGGMPGVAAMAQAGFAATEIDRETETGYERTTTIEGHRALEQYDSRYESGSIMIMAKKRLSFEVKGNQVPMEAVHAAVDALDFEAISGLIEKAQKEAEEAEAASAEE